MFVAGLQLSYIMTETYEVTVICEKRTESLNMSTSRSASANLVSDLNETFLVECDLNQEMDTHKLMADHL